MVNFGVRTLFLLAATILFIFGVFTEEDWQDLISAGLACVAFSFLLADIGWDRKYGTRR